MYSTQIYFYLKIILRRDENKLILSDMCVYGKALICSFKINICIAQYIAGYISQVRAHSTRVIVYYAKFQFPLCIPLNSIYEEEETHQIYIGKGVGAAFTSTNETYKVKNIVGKIQNLHQNFMAAISDATVLPRRPSFASWRYRF